MSYKAILLKKKKVSDKKIITADWWQFKLLCRSWILKPGNNFSIILEYSRIFPNICEYLWVFLTIFEYFRIFCNILEYSEYSKIKWNNNYLEYSILSWSILEYSKIFQNIPEYSHWKVVLGRYCTCFLGWHYLVPKYF